MSRGNNIKSPVFINIIGISFSLKNQNSHNLLTLTPFQICMTYFFLCNAKRDILIFMLVTFVHAITIKRGLKLLSFKMDANANAIT